MVKFKRILLKLSGESLMGSQSYGIDPNRLADYAQQIKEVHDMGVQVSIVIGGGNIFRGLSGSQKGFDRVKGDQMGMCATVINSLALSFTTDTGSSLRGIEIEADVMLKGTRVDGVYTADPEKDPTATKFDDITFDEVYNRHLKVMDLTATAMCKENNLPVYVFNMDVVGNLKKVLEGEPIGTLVHN